MTIKSKHLFFSLMCIIFCIIPATLLTINFSPIQTAEAVIIGPIIDPGIVLDPVIPDYDKPVAKEWSASTDVPVANPNADGSLKSYTSLYVKNDKFSKVYKPDRLYSSFVKYFKIVRTDGRPIYDDDGILDVSWWKDGIFTDCDEIVDYEADLYIKTQMCNFNYKGFCGTVLYDKFERASFEITWGRSQDSEDSRSSKVHDLNLNNYGAGPYKNNSINPGFEYYKLTDLEYSPDSPFVTVELNAKAFWENCFWGGCYDYIDIYDNLTGFMHRAKRNWSNELKTTTSQGSHKGQTAFYSPKPFTVTATNLNNYVKFKYKFITL